MASPSSPKPETKPNDDAEEMKGRHEEPTLSLAPEYAAGTASTLLPPESSLARGAIHVKNRGAVPVKSSTGTPRNKKNDQPVLELSTAMAEDEQKECHERSGRDQTNPKHPLLLAPGCEPETAGSTTDEDSSVAPGAFAMNGISSGGANSQSETTMNFPVENPLPSAESVTSNNPLHVEAMLVDEGEARERMRQEVRQEILGEAVVGEITGIADGSDENKNDGTDSTHNSRRKMIVGISMILIILLVGSVVGIVLGTAKHPAVTSPPAETSKVPSSTPTSTPASQPSLSPRPTSEVPTSNPTTQLPILDEEQNPLTGGCNGNGGACGCGFSGDGSQISMSRFDGDENDEQVMGCGDAFSLDGASLDNQWGGSISTAGPVADTANSIGLSFSQDISYNGWEGCCYICGANLQLAGKVSDGWYCEKDLFWTGIWLKGKNK